MGSLGSRTSVRVGSPGQWDTSGSTALGSGICGSRSPASAMAVVSLERGAALEAGLQGSGTGASRARCQGSGCPQCPQGEPPALAHGTVRGGGEPPWPWPLAPLSRPQLWAQCQLVSKALLARQPAPTGTALLPHTRPTGTGLQTPRGMLYPFPWHSEWKASLAALMLLSWCRCGGAAGPGQA